MSNLSNNYIAGDWVKGASSISNINPSNTNDIIGEFAQASSAQLEDALNSAQVAQRQWAATGLEQRQAVLMKIGEEMMARSAELGELLSIEEGKPVAEGKGEVYRAGQFFTYYAAEVLRQGGDTADSVRPNIEIDVRREPMDCCNYLTMELSNCNSELENCASTSLWQCCYMEACEPNTCKCGSIN